MPVGKIRPKNWQPTTDTRQLKDMQNISVEELKKRLDAGEKINIVDVREPHEHADFNIGGILYPLGHIQTMQVDELEDFKDQEVVLYCRSGNRSGQACMILDMLGFKDTKNLTGGMLAWEEKFGR
jgi:rhodanese-related sulfurtransferase